MSAQFDEAFYSDKSWGTNAVHGAWDLPTLKIRYLMETLRERTNRDATLLEVGCGSGRILRSIRERDPALALTGIDVGAAQIESARHAHAGLAIDYRIGTGEQLPFDDASFDYVIFLDYLEHIERPRASLHEMARVLRPGGTLHFVCPVEGELLTPYRFSRAIFKRHFKETTLGHIQQFTRSGLEAMVAGSGFRIERRRFSYHLAGSTMDYALYALLLDPRIAAVYWKHDKYHATLEQEAPSLAGRILNLAMTFGNAIAYLESTILKNVPLFASVVHIDARKPATNAS